MPVDQRRINGPEVTIPYEIYIDSSVKKTTTNDHLLEKRKDGRAHNEMRKMYVKTNVVSQAKGSAYIEMGQTKVVCSVFDPREIVNKSNYSTQGELFCKFKFAPFSCGKRKIHQQDSEEKQYSIIMQRALESAVCRDEFPNFQVDIYATVLDNDGSALGAAIMAASLALANAGVSMFGIVTAVTMGVHGNTTFLDPTSDEEALCMSPNFKKVAGKNHGLIMQAMLPQHNQVSEFFFVGNVDTTRLTNIIQPLEKANNDVSPIIQKCLDAFIWKCLKQNKLKDQNHKTEL